MKFRRKRKGIIYIYERTTVDGKRHEKVIGKVDKDGNEIYCNDHRVRGNRASGGKGWGHEESAKEESKSTSDIVISYRIKSNAENKDGKKIANADIEVLAIPTLNEYENAISLCNGGKAYLCPVVSTQGLRFETGKHIKPIFLYLYFRT